MFAIWSQRARTVSKFDDLKTDGVNMVRSLPAVSAVGGAVAALRWCVVGLDVGGCMGGSLSVRREDTRCVDGCGLDGIRLSWNTLKVLDVLVVGLVACLRKGRLMLKRVLI